MGFDEIVAADTKLTQVMSLVGNGGLSESEALKACVCELAKRLNLVIVRCDMLGDPLSVIGEIRKIAKGE